MTSLALLNLVKRIALEKVWREMSDSATSTDVAVAGRVESGKKNEGLDVTGWPTVQRSRSLSRPWDSGLKQEF
jgi:hypothetical protein